MSNFDNTPDSGSGFWWTVLILLLVAGVCYFATIYNSGDSDYWEIRISHTPNGFEIKKYDYDEIMNDALEKAQKIMDENY